MPAEIGNLEHTEHVCKTDNIKCMERTRKNNSVGTLLFYLKYCGYAPFYLKFYRHAQFYFPRRIMFQLCFPSTVASLPSSILDASDFAGTTVSGAASVFTAFISSLVSTMCSFT